jgi:hypothetical protein
MLQLSENKRRRQAQIAKKFKNVVYASASFLEDEIPASLALFLLAVSRETPRGFSAEHTATATNWNFPPPGATVDSPPSACNIRHLTAGVGKR